jgi:gamma-glutamylcysteine synthetase
MSQLQSFENILERMGFEESARAVILTDLDLMKIATRLFLFGVTRAELEEEGISERERKELDRTERTIFNTLKKRFEERKKAIIQGTLN